jgi:predicted RNase H-like nuclease (RuvC/YqgF family)
MCDTVLRPPKTTPAARRIVTNRIREDVAALKREMSELSDMIGNLAEVELTLHNELNQLSSRTVHVKESLRKMHQISEKLAELLTSLERRAKTAAGEHFHDPA